MKARISDMKRRIAEDIVNSGQKGVTRTHLMQRFRLSTSDLETLLSTLLMEQVIKQQQDPARRFGRPALRYYAPSVELAAVPSNPPAMPILPFGEAPTARSSPCQVCGVAIPLPEIGRPHVYCSDACRRASRDGGPEVKEFFDRTTDPRTRARVGLCIVMADLCVRGFQIAVDFFSAPTRLIVHDGEGITFLDVIVISDSGHFPPPEDYESVAFVYRDGKIVYTGRQPLITVTAINTVEGTK